MTENDSTGTSGGFGRREYLRGLLAAGGVASLGLPGVTATASAEPDSRRSAAHSERVTSADYLIDPDESDLARYTPSADAGAEANGRTYGKYAKCLAGVSGDGSIDSTNYQAFVITLEDPSADNGSIGLNADRKLVSPSSAYQLPTEGMDSWMAAVADPPSYGSNLDAGEMIINYWLAYFRDVPFGQWENDPLYDQYEEDLGSVHDTYSPNNRYGAPGYVSTTDALGAWTGGNDWGGTGDQPYLSQFYTHRAIQGNVEFAPRVQELTDDYMTDQNGFYSVWSGQSEGSAEPGGTTASPVEGNNLRWISTGRDLASLVRDEASYQHYLMAATQLFAWGCPIDPSLTDDDDAELEYTNYGGAGVLDLLARAAGNALDAAWYLKWLGYRRNRPEATGANVANGDPASSIHSILMNSNAVNNSNVTASGFLSQAYPEGSPAHPAYPSGHSAIAGACVTVLKAMFENREFSQLPNLDQWGGKRAPSTDGTEPQDDSVSDTLTVHGELDKLADNVGVGRLWAGVHYWSDHVAGLLIGEQVAMATMMDVLVEDFGTYEPIGNLTFPEFRAGTSRAVTVSELDGQRGTAQDSYLW